MESGETVNHCPVCRQTAHITPNSTIRRHRDQAGHNCPASGQPWRITANDLGGAA